MTTAVMKPAEFIRRADGSLVTVEEAEHWTELLLEIPGYDCFETAANAPDGGLWFDSEAALNVIHFIESHLTHIKGQWAQQPLILERWELAIVANLFGWKREDGTRRYRKCLIYVPRKNGKTILSAALCIVLLVLDGEPSGEIFTAAGDRDQAKIMWRLAGDMIEADATLDSICQVHPTGNAITYGGSSYRAISSEGKTKHGYNPSAAVFDELHVQPNGELLEALETGMGARRQPLTIYATTADNDRPSVCNDILNAAIAARDALSPDIAGYDEYFLPVIYQATAADDWTLEETWKKANPNYGISVLREFMIAACKDARSKPSKRNSFLRLHLNIRTQQVEHWDILDHWDQCPDEIDMDALHGRRCFGGLDLSSKRDTTCWVLVFPGEGDEPWIILPRFFIPEDNARERARLDQVPYPIWHEQGLLEMTLGNTVNQQHVRNVIVADAEKYDLVEIGFDPWNAGKIAQELQDDDGITMIVVRQGFQTLSEPTKLFETLILEHRCNHGHHKVLRWQMGNVALENDSNDNVRINKKKSRERVDGPAATANALVCALADDGHARSAYDGLTKDEVVKRMTEL